MATSVKPTFTVVEGPGGEEFQATLAQSKEISNSCIKAALTGLTFEQKSQLKQAIEKLKDLVGQAGDGLRARQSKVHTQLQRLQKQKDASDASGMVYSDFYRLFSPAIAVCPDAATTAASSHTAVQPVVRESVELSYKILLAQTQEGLLIQRMKLVQDALASLDRASYAIS